ncbi:MAG: hypothetical protein KIS77_20045 [Saprospiraceae bacterium]|nr:hypothetical protein [Saprospiraceae bacterium]
MFRSLFLSSLMFFLFAKINAQTTLNEAVVRLRQSGFADENTWLYPEFEPRSNRIKISKTISDCGRQIAVVDASTGTVTLSDTMLKWSFCTKLEERVKTAALVIEGECIEQAPAYKKTAGNWPSAYTPHLIKVFKVFKGEPMGDTIVAIRYGGRLPDGSDVSLSHGMLDLPDPGQRAILFLADFQEKEYHDMGARLNRYPKWAGVENSIFITAPDLPPAWEMVHIEDNLYKNLERITGQPRQILGHPIWHLEKMPPDNEKKPEYWEEPGIQYTFQYAKIDAKQPDVFHLRLKLQSELDNTYPVQGEIRLRYNPIVFGKKAISNKTAVYSTQVSNYSFGAEKLHRAVFPRSYEVTVRDSDDSTLMIRFQRNDSITQPVMLPYTDGFPWLDFTIKIQNYEAKSGLQLMIPSDWEEQNRHFDYEKNTIVPYRHIRTATLPDVLLSYFLKPRIDRFHPDTVAAGSAQVVTVEGQYLLSEKTWIGIPCQQGHCFIKEENIIELTENCIRFIVPVAAEGSVGRVENIPLASAKFMVLKQTGNSQAFDYTRTPLAIIR